MSSNYKYKGKPLDEIAATVTASDKNKYDRYFNNGRTEDITFKLSDVGFSDVNENVFFLRPPRNFESESSYRDANIAGGLWGKDIINLGYDLNNYNFLSKRCINISLLNSDYLTNYLVNHSKYTTYRIDKADMIITYRDNATYIDDYKQNSDIISILIQAEGAAGGESKIYHNAEIGRPLVEHTGYGGGSGAALFIIINGKNIRKKITFKYDNDTGNIKIFNDDTYVISVESGSGISGGKVVDKDGRDIKLNTLIGDTIYVSGVFNGYDGGSGYHYSGVGYVSGGSPASEGSDLTTREYFIGNFYSESENPKINIYNGGSISAVDTSFMQKDRLIYKEAGGGGGSIFGFGGSGRRIYYPTNDYTYENGTFIIESTSSPNYGAGGGGASAWAYYTGNNYQLYKYRHPQQGGKAIIFVFKDE